jgi:ABC-type multidrug transport system permease subunit
MKVCVFVCLVIATCILHVYRINHIGSSLLMHTLASLVYFFVCIYLGGANPIHLLCMF